MVGVGTFVMRTKENLCVIKPYKDIIILNKIRFPEELRSYDELKIPKKTVKEGELKMAVALIEQTSEKFKPEQYVDTYKEDLLKIIEQKAKGKKPKISSPKEKPDKAIDLMAQLKASLDKSKKKAS